jgi:hypothetical protein
VSWARRGLVVLAFAMMIAGVALLVTQESELFLILSVAGFALVLVAVPSLPREAEQDEPAPEDEATERAATPAAAGGRTGTVTVLARSDGAAQAAGADAGAAPDRMASPSSEPDAPIAATDPETDVVAGSATSAPATAPSPAPAAPAEPEGPSERQPDPLEHAAPVAPEAIPAPDADIAGDEPEPAVASVPGPPPYVAESSPTPVPAGSSAGAHREVSPRTVAAAGAASVAAGAALWIIRRVRR